MTLIDDNPTTTGSEVPDVHAWVARIAELTKPARVVWCDGSGAERHRLIAMGVRKGTLEPLPEPHYGSYLVRSAPDDVARVEDRTVIATTDPDDAGPTNNWRDPVDLEAELVELFDGSMRGRTMWVVPFSMGPVGGPISQLGVQVTDSLYAVLSMGTMTRVGTAARELIEAGAPWVPAVHSVGYPLEDEFGQPVREDVAWPSNETKLIAHFPESRQIWSFGSGYGGNALLGKKCFALRIASAMGREEGWLAEHMLLVRVTSPEGRQYHVAGAFPSACGKTNFAMMTPSLPGWKVETLGDDIVWMRRDEQGRLRAINPEAGFFGVAPGTSEATNPAAHQMLWGNTIFTNCAQTADGDVWWEGLTPTPPLGLVDWTGQPWSPESGRPAAHPNARFTVAAEQCPTLADSWDDPEGVVVDAILFGGRRATTVPLVAQARDWAHGVFLGATMASEKTAAAEGVVGEVRRDPFAMLPFTGYNAADHWSHWLEQGELLGENAPALFSVNWFRKDADGGFLWPGFGENSRVLEWVVARLEGRVDAVDTPAGLVPRTEDLDVAGIDLAREALEELLTADPADYAREADGVAELFALFGDRVPAPLLAQLEELRQRSGGALGAA
ncbi:phosphoenolpyruvate carboxykinase (GTP) [Quadrisphaera setariae]|uniref:Phosphoenolpyruvate carboxykinase [GTP] n=1 Tax=Quadrisphaera setariae TaxID=2593304 RepID=A0A5C8ZGH2_9ACTN|nr:phosphoenolpyruvate carboxykinase (GTP) [Quadrisphaera setariae]TXR57155.1 phosphoenolpyruvate carboxykinase (GTP) [Quadrisphaera setariae]